MMVTILLQTQQSKWVGYQGTLDYHGSDFTASITAANPDILAGSGMIVLQYLQSLSNRFVLTLRTRSEVVTYWLITLGCLWAQSCSIRRQDPIRQHSCR